MSNRSTARLSVVIPAHNDGVKLTRCLEAVRASDYADYECIVVDDGSTEEIHAVAAPFGARVIRVSDGARGPAHARNAGSAASAGDILVFVDADVVIAPDTLRRFAADFEQHPEVSAVFGSYDDAPAVADFISQYKNLFHHFVHQEARVEAATFWSGCGAIRRDIFLSAGGFDEVRYRRPSIEDIELGYRLRAAGHRIMLDKQIQVKHLKRWTLRGLMKTDIFDRGVPWTRLILEYKNLPNDLNLNIEQRVCAVLAGGMWLYLAGMVFFLDAGRWPLLAWPLLIAALFIVALNRRLYAFFAERRGVAFAIAAFPLHLLYYSYNLFALALGTASYLVSPSKASL